MFFSSSASAAADVEPNEKLYIYISAENKNGEKKETRGPVEEELYFLEARKGREKRLWQ